MNELQRQQYLEALGVESYMPRRILPAAPAIRRCEAPVITSPINEDPVKDEPVRGESVRGEAKAADVSPKKPEAPVAAAIDTKVEEVSAAAAEPLVSLLDEPENVAPKTTEQDETKAPATDVSFSLGVWRISDDLLVVDSRKAELALPVDALLLNMLTALGYPQAPLPKVEVIRWPRVENAFTDKSETAARSMTNAIVSAKLELQPVKYLLLLGADACHYVLPPESLTSSAGAEDSLAQLLGKAIRLNDLNCSAIVIPSLVDMLQDPSLKSVAWRAIQPLRLQ